MKQVLDTDILIRTMPDRREPFSAKETANIPFIAEQLKLLADPSRLQLIAWLREQELCVCELVELSGLSQPNVSQHIRKLKSGGLVSESKRGQWVYYRLIQPQSDYLQAVFDALPSHAAYVQQMRFKSDICDQMPDSGGCCETEAGC